jgi:membrane protein YdbS with pleckstrin-like domain
MAGLQHDAVSTWKMLELFSVKILPVLILGILITLYIYYYTPVFRGIHWTTILLSFTVSLIIVLIAPDF